MTMVLCDHPRLRDPDMPPSSPREILTRLLPAVAACVLGFAVARPAIAATGRVAIDVGGQRRIATVIETVRLKRAPRPAIIVLRGEPAGPRRNGLARADRFLGLDDMAAVSGAVVAFPLAAGGKWDLGANGDRDAAFVRALAAKLVADGIADRRRVYLVGVSSGGLLALRILCGGADYVAGAAVLIANMPASFAPACKPARPIPFFMLSGDADPLMPYKGGVANLADFKEPVVSANDTAAPFLAAADCGKTRTSRELPDKDPRDGTRVVVEHPVGCKAAIDIYHVEGGGHVLPGRPIRADRGAIVGARNNDVDASRALSDFFRRIPRQ